MFNFNLETAKIFQAVKWERQPVFRYSEDIKRISSYVFILSFLLFVIGLLADLLKEAILAPLFGISIISLISLIFFSIQASFFNSKLKNPAPPALEPELQKKIIEVKVPELDNYNLAEFLSFDIAKIVFKSTRFAKIKKIPKVTSRHLFYFLLKDNPKINFIFFRALLRLNEIKETLRNQLSGEKSSNGNKNFEYSDDFQKIIFESFKICQIKGHQKIEVGDMLTAFSRIDPFFKEILVEAKLKAKDIENLTWWLESLEAKVALAGKFWDEDSLRRKGSLAKDWASGYTVTLDQYSIEWTEIIKRRGPEEIIGHKRAIEETERILARTEINNVLLIGEPGTGRKSIIHNLAQRAFYGQSLPELNYKRIVELDLASLLSRITSLENVEVVLDKIFKEVIQAGNIILVIDDFQNYVGQTAKPGILDISGSLSPFLPLPSFPVVAITSFAGLHKNIEQNPSLLSLFEKVEVSEISEQETILILENIVPFFEKKYKRFVTYPALRDIISHAARYIQNVPFPKKAVDLLDEAMVYAARYAKEKFILPEHIAKIVSEKTQIPVGEVEIKEREILLNLENLIHQRIINQEEAVREVSESLRRARADITVRKGPMGCFLFLGPTGVGKTETSKALAEIYFGSESKMIRLDMSEFQAIQDIPRLLGAEGEEGLLTTPVRENPFSLILLDELEKAHPNILNLFLQVLDEGHITDGLGRKLSFANTIIIATSNAGYQLILESLKQRVDWAGVKDKLLDSLFAQGVFRPEFINRFDAVVVFKPLSKENLLSIVGLLLSKLKQNLAKKDIEFIITPQLKEKIAELSYDPIFGAREMRRVIQDKVEDVLAEALLRNDIKRGDKIEIDSEGFKLIIK